MTSSADWEYDIGDLIQIDLPGHEKDGWTGQVIDRQSIMFYDKPIEAYWLDIDSDPWLEQTLMRFS